MNCNSVAGIVQFTLSNGVYVAVCFYATDFECIVCDRLYVFHARRIYFGAFFSR
jgi:hypothetical protein